jgi:hypothetical protein
MQECVFLPSSYICPLGCYGLDDDHAPVAGGGDPELQNCVSKLERRCCVPTAVGHVGRGPPGYIEEARMLVQSSARR